MILLAARNLVTERTRFAFSAAGIGFAMKTRPLRGIRPADH